MPGVPGQSPDGLCNNSIVDTTDVANGELPQQENPGFDVLSQLTSPSPTATVEIAGISFGCVLDTGAETSLMPASLYEKYFSGIGSPGIVGDFFKVIGASGLEVPIDGYILVPLTVFGVTIDHCGFLIQRDSEMKMEGRRAEFPVILGCNILRKLSQSKFDPTQIASSDLNLIFNTLTKNSTNIETNQNSKPELHFCISNGASSKILPSESMCILNCLVPDCEQDGTLLVSPRDVSPIAGLFVCEGCYEVKDRQVGLFVGNIDSVPIEIPSECSIAVASALQFSDQIIVQPTVHGLELEIQTIAVQNSSECEAVPSESDDETIGNNRVPQLDDRELYIFKNGETYILPPGISLKDRTPEEAEMAAELIRKRDAAFSHGAFDLGHCNIIPHRVQLTDSKPISLPYRRIPPQDMKEVRDQLQELLDKGIIRKSNSPYGSPVVIVRKKNGTIRLCIDYRQLNAKTIGDAFPLPRIEEALEALGGSKIFSSLDLAHGYFQVAVHEDSVPTTAFRVPWGLFEFLRLPQGMKNSPATFQRIMEYIFGDLNYQSLLLYIFGDLNYQFR